MRAVESRTPVWGRAVEIVGAISSTVALALMVWLDWARIHPVLRLMFMVMVFLGIVFLGIGVPILIIWAGSLFIDELVDAGIISRKDDAGCGVVLVGGPLFLYYLLLTWLFP